MDGPINGKISDELARFGGEPVMTASVKDDRVAEVCDWSAEQHHADRGALSFSMLRHLGQVTEDGEELNPSLFRAYLDGQVEPPKSEALSFGTVVHMAVYEPHRLEARVAVRPTKPNGDLVRGNSNEFKAWAVENIGKIFVTPEEWSIAERVLEACRKSPSLQALRRFPALYTETTIVWKDRETGLALKCRPDRVSERPDGWWVAEDLKTTVDVYPAAFRKACLRYGYFDRAAFYIDGLKALTGEAPRFALIAVSKQEPFQVAVYEPRPERIEEGRLRNRALLREVARCFDENDWMAPWERTPVLL